MEYSSSSRYHLLMSIKVNVCSRDQVSVSVLSTSVCCLFFCCLYHVFSETVADPNLVLREGGGFDLLALQAFFSSVISSFFTQNKERPGPRP